MLNPGLTTSRTDDWGTPESFFSEINKEFKFDLDVCASHKNAKCERYFTKEDNGLNQEWKGVCWMNPPYGRKIGNWIKKAYESSIRGATVVCLIPSRTDTAWWHDYAMKGEVRFVRGRIYFEPTCDRAPFPSAIVVFRPGQDNRSFMQKSLFESDGN